MEPDTDQDTGIVPRSPERLIAFARFFKKYMSVSALVIAALPIPVTSLRLIPAYAAQARFLSVYTSLFCFLTLGYIFYIRHALARVMFPEILERVGPAAAERASLAERTAKLIKLTIGTLVRSMPILLIIVSMASIGIYHSYLDFSVGQLHYRPGPNSVGMTRSDSTDSSILDDTTLFDIPYSPVLIVSYIIIFLSAEASFVMMAIREYLQDLLKLTEQDLIEGRRTSSIRPPQ